MEKQTQSSIKDLNFAVKEVLSANEACVYLNVSISWLYKLTHLKKIPHYKPNGKLIYFKKSDLNIWLLRNRVSSQEEIERKAEEYVTKETDSESSIK
jgi:excisionase family DNA binding protein